MARRLPAQFVRDTEEGYKLQTAQERGGFQPKPKDLREILRELLDEIFSEPSLKRYRYKDLKTFSVGVTVDGVRLGSDGQIPLSVRVAEDAEELARKLSEATSLTQERNEQRRLRNSLVGKLSEAIAGGQGVFQGVTRDASDLGIKSTAVGR
jgi:hypothetical protein